MTLTPINPKPRTRRIIAIEKLKMMGDMRAVDSSLGSNVVAHVQTGAPLVDV